VIREMLDHQVLLEGLAILGKMALQETKEKRELKVMLVILVQVAQED
jgi:hypothetical protein